MIASATATRSAALDTWVRFFRGQAAVLKELEGRLVRDHGLTLNDYEALSVLSGAPDGLRRTDLAARLQLTASGVTRLLDGLERSGFVARAECERDGRVTYAVLTDRGLVTLEAASASHVRAVEALLRARYGDDELATLVELLGRLPGADSASCGER